MIDNTFNDNFINRLGFYSFEIGIIFLASAFPISIIFFLVSALIGCFTYIKEKKFDFFDLPIIICFFLMPIICLLQSSYPYKNPFEIDPSLKWIGLLNWLPFFLLFLFFKSYLDTDKKREITAKLFIIGTFPVLISGFGQYFFKWQVSLEAFNGLIIWFQKPITTQGLSGLFSNPNYAGAWFNFVFPFVMASFLKYTKSTLKKNISLVFLIAISTSIVLTKSRSAWGGLFFALPFLLGPYSLIWLVPLFIVIFFGIYFASAESININIQEFARLILPENLWTEFDSNSYTGTESRLSIWNTAITLLKKRPTIGLGAGSFALIYFNLKKAYVGHAHNLPLEVAVNFGLPISSLIFSFIFFIIIISFYKLVKNNSFNKNILKTSLFERAWWTSFLIICISNLFDVVLYDGRLRLVFWILFTGLVQIVRNKNENLISYENK